MKRYLFPILMMLIMLTACNQATPTAAPTEAPTPTLLPPTPTSLPMALRVNGDGILLSDYQAELTRLQQAQIELDQATTPEEQRDRIVNNYVDLLLLAQAAGQNGFSLDDATLQARLDKLAADAGGAEQLSAWQAANGYTADSFKAALRLEITAVWQRDQIINAVPTTAEHIHALQILYQDEANALDALQKLKDGTNFAELALKVDPTTGGELGWFAAGTLTQPAVDEAAFALQAGQYSEVIKSEFGYHIIYVVDRDPQHPLSVDGRRVLQEAALAKWLEAARAASSIEVLVQ
jgi:parvulin-like peptidyl-prolyl isomerase